MKIGFLGNTNNYPFRLARAMRMLGHEVLFFVDRPRSESRYRPEWHYTDVSYPYPDWIQEVAPLVPVRLVVMPTRGHQRILRLLGTCDGIVLNGLALGLGPLLRAPTIGLLTGSDLDVYANPQSARVLAAAAGRFDQVPGARLLKRMLFERLVKRQRAGIAQCCLVEYAIPGLLPSADALLDGIGVAKERRDSFMLTDTEALPRWRDRRREIFRIFCATRLQWRRPSVGANISPLDAKGTDTMLEGLRKFVARTRQPVRIDLIRVGADAEEVERKVVEMELGSSVHWHAELSQAEFLHEMSQSDVVLENFGTDGCLGMAGRDAIAMGMPVVAWGKSEVFERVLGEALPIYEARTADEICARLGEIANDSAGVVRHSARARAFAKRWFSTRQAAERCVAAFQDAGKNRPRAATWKKTFAPGVC